MSTDHTSNPHEPQNGKSTPLQKILQFLSVRPNESFSAKDLARHLYPEEAVVSARILINRSLYELHEHRCVQQKSGIPVLWTIDPSWVCKPHEDLTHREHKASGSELPEITVVLVDLGGVHDCLAKLVPYVNEQWELSRMNQTPCELEVYAFADLAFNGYGINPPAPNYIKVYHATTAHKNSADIALIWTVADLIFNRGNVRRFHFVVATKDHGFQSLKEVVEKYGHSMEFVINWNQLRPYVE